MDEHKNDNHKHHILSNIDGLKVFIGLLVLTVVTVAASRVDFGAFNFIIAMFIASIKAVMVVLFFMGLKYDENENRVIFSSSLFFLFVFIFLTAADIYTRSLDWRVATDKPLLKEVAGANLGAPKFKKAWIPTDDLKSRGKDIYMQQCQICHGSQGAGDGPAAAALNPKPRNFTDGAGWKNGRKPTDVFGTLTKGLNTMPSFGQLPIEDRWALTHYVLSFGPDPAKSTDEDLKKVGILDQSKDDGGMSGSTQRTIPIDFAIDRYVEP